MLTPLQQQKYDRLRTYVLRQRRCPSFSELQTLWSLKSKNAVSLVVSALETAGLLERSERGVITRVAAPLELLGSVRAGTLTAADETVAQLDTIDDFLISHRDKTFLLKIAGDSMEGAGLLDGDIVILEKGAAPRSGEIVVARVENEWTVKHYHPTKSGLELLPANPRYKPIRVEGEAEIIGVVTGSFRKYR